MHRSKGPVHVQRQDQVRGASKIDYERSSDCPSLGPTTSVGRDAGTRRGVSEANVSTRSLLTYS